MTSRAPTLLLAVLGLAACDATSYREARLRPVAAPPAAAPPAPPRTADTFRFSVAAVQSPRDTYGAYSRLFERMGERLGVDIEFVQRRTYREVNDLLASGQLDAAFLCTGGYLDLKRRAPDSLEVVAVPVVAGVPTYHAVVIVPAASVARELADLEGKRFAFTDELSFSGRAYVVRLLRDLHRDPQRFFGSVVYTQSHDRSITGVAAGIVDGAAVHQGVLEHLLHDDPSLVRRIRVIHRSPAFGAMPVVASTRLAPEVRARLREVLVGLADDPEGAAALRILGVERFAEPPPGLYASAERIVEDAR